MTDPELIALSALVGAESLSLAAANRVRLDDGGAPEWTGPTEYTVRLDAELRRRSVLDALPAGTPTPTGDNREVR